MGHAAGAPLGPGSRGLMTDLSGGEGWYESGNVVCGNSKLMRQLLPSSNGLNGSVEPGAAATRQESKPTAGGRLLRI